MSKEIRHKRVVPVKTRVLLSAKEEQMEKAASTMLSPRALEIRESGHLRLGESEADLYCSEADDQAQISPIYQFPLPNLVFKGPLSVIPSALPTPIWETLMLSS